ncbi:MAG: hypothetical protein DMG07_09115 [Acidobacteria bacterium]|nr:MAG: hypothetical protein DMG07_09115 [Acidobacteriota bacterium]
MSRKGFWGLSGSDCKKATNPCPCGFHGDAARECACTPPQIQHYGSRIAGPPLDMHIQVPDVKYKDLVHDEESADSATIRERIVAARERQNRRLAPFGIFCNSQMTPRTVRRFCKLDGECGRLLENALTRVGLSARAYERILHVSRTMADLEDSGSIKGKHMAEAIQ